ncbi:hypothetical protein NE237_007020 [Protea cynaroides]|uniref:Disease resistance protein RGA3 n=1 Tax=Protea cynaroides TaxID=273540 RepID=A0A9Q0KP71_9MAGN|nr:hypothetical protein NE237_007020 [Protea cynaroides]
MVDAFVSSVIKQLAMIIQKEIEQEVRLVMNVQKDVKKLTHTFMKIQAVLKDAEKRQIEENSVQLWLQDLRDLAYDIDDVVDEWKTEIYLKSIVEGVHTSPTTKVCSSNLFSLSCYPSFMRIGLRRDIGHRIKEINERLNGIASEKDRFGFSETSRNESVVESRRRLETSSLVDVNEVFGRTRDKDIIISELLVSDEGSHPQQEVVSAARVVPPIISIVGMPGLGKTTLAQLVFNDDRVINHFNKRIWVHVSKSFDKMTVAMNIIREISGVNIDGHEHISWESMHRQLDSCVAGKHFLLMLDDVWNEDRKLWDPLWFSLKKGSPGSKIMFTTRNEKVAMMMGSTYVHRLKILSNEDCWSLLRHYAFMGREKEESDKLKEIGVELVKKCNGLPLSAKTLGSLLCFKKTRQDWESILVSDLWSVVSSTFDHNSVLPALLLSYYELSSHLKQCFALSSISGPRGSTFTKQYMIRIWMAQGFLGNSLVASSEDLLAIGGEYFDNLVMRSLFQKSIKTLEWNNEFRVYVMHDLVHDFAKSLVENECFTFAVKEYATKAFQEFNFSRARHLFLATEGIKEIPSFFYKAKNLRTLIITGHIPSVSSELFLRLTCLRTLDLGGTYIEEFPNEIEKLIHLRYLNLADARFKELPKTVFNLCNLQVLLLNRCRNLCKLPDGIDRLVNLIELNVGKCHQLSYLPEKIGRLSRLRRLSNFIIGTGVERGGCKMRELKDLNLLKGSLDIIGLGRVENGNEAAMADLKNKQYLYALYLFFDRYTGLSLVDEYSRDQEGENKEKEEVVDGEGKTERREEEEVVDGEGKTEGEEEEIMNGEGNTKEEEEKLMEEICCRGWRMCSKVFNQIQILRNYQLMTTPGPYSPSGWLIMRPS